MPPDNIEQVKATQGAVFCRSRATRVVVTLNTKKPPFDNPLLRQAVNYAR